MSLTAGSRLGPYEILAAIGAGGMGEVYRARDTRLNRSVAVKVLPSELAADPERRNRFEREAHAIAALSHPHICTIHDVGRENGTDYLVMELLEGETLADRLASGSGLQASSARPGRSLSISETLKIAIEIADALDKAHRAGIVHRDLKPANIMLTKSGAKLLDFGLAKLKGPAVPISMTAIAHADDHRRSEDGERDDSGHRPLHVARAGGRTRSRRAQRYLGARRRHLRDGDRHPAVRRRFGRQHHRRDSQRRPEAVVTTSAAGTSRTGSCGGALPGARS